MLFGWIGQLLGFGSKLFDVADQFKQTDPEYQSRLLEANELKTQEDKLFAKYVRCLSDDGEKKKLCREWRAKTKPKQAMLADLKNALLEEGLMKEHDDLVFKHYVQKLDTQDRNQLLRAYHRCQGQDPAVWKVLMEGLRAKNLRSEAGEVQPIFRTVQADWNAAHRAQQEERDRQESAKQAQEAQSQRQKQEDELRNLFNAWGRGNQGNQGAQGGYAPQNAFDMPNHHAGPAYNPMFNAHRNRGASQLGGPRVVRPENMGSNGSAIPLF